MQISAVSRARLFHALHSSTLRMRGHLRRRGAQHKNGRLGDRRSHPRRWRGLQARMIFILVENHDQSSLTTGLQEATLERPLSQLGQLSSTTRGLNILIAPPNVMGTHRTRSVTKTITQVSTDRAALLPEFLSGCNIVMGYGLGATVLTIVLRMQTEWLWATAMAVLR